jgi:hypothetical protein
VIARRPLLLALVLGCGISLLSAGRFTVRLIVDGALSFAFVPLCELAAFALVHRLGRTSLPFPHAVDRFFAGNTSWLWWLIAIMTAAALLPVTRQATLLAPMLITAAIPIVLSMRFDLTFCRDVLARTRGRAMFDVALLRMIAWSGATAYFFGVAVTRRDFFYLSVEMWDLITGWVAELA